MIRDDGIIATILYTAIISWFLLGIMRFYL